VIAVFTPELEVMANVPTERWPSFILREKEKVSKSEQSIRDALLSVRQNYDLFRYKCDISFNYTIVMCEMLMGRPSNARFSWLPASEIGIVLVNMENCPVGAEMGYDPKWILDRVVHELAEFIVMRTLKMLEHSLGGGEAKKVLRDVCKDYYPEMVPMKNF